MARVKKFTCVRIHNSLYLKSRKLGDKLAFYQHSEHFSADLEAFGTEHRSELDAGLRQQRALYRFEPRITRPRRIYRAPCRLLFNCRILLPRRLSAWKP